MKNTESALFFLLSIFFFVKCLSRKRCPTTGNDQVAGSRPRKRTQRVRLRGLLAFRCSGDRQQVFDGDSAGCSLLVRLVDGGPVALALSGKSGPHPSNGNRCQCLIDMDAKLATGDSYRSTMGGCSRAFVLDCC